MAIKLNIPEASRHGIYANYFLSNFTEHEFRLHFGYLMPPQDPDKELEADILAKINVPVALLPEIIRVLQENYKKYGELKSKIPVDKPENEND